MKKILIILSIVSFTFSCSKSELKKDFKCNSNYNFKKTIITSDFKNKFSLEIPKSWNIKYFYNSFQTSLMTADSLKTLTKSFILDVSLNSGELNLNNNFKEKVINNIKKEHLKLIKYKNIKFKEKDAIWFWSKGKQNKYNYNVLKLIAKNTATSYFEIETKIYGDSLIEERLCKSISILETLKIVK